MAQMNKGAWSKQEDEKLISYIRTHGEGRWSSIPQAAGLRRCGKGCRLRWINYLRPDLKRGNFSEDEDDLILKLHALLGNRWSLIAGRLPGRTDNEIKNYWNSHLRRKLMSMGVDPRNHRPSTVAAPLRNQCAGNSAPPLRSPLQNGHVCRGCAPPLDRTADRGRCSEGSCSGGRNPVSRNLDIDLNVTLPDPTASPKVTGE